MKTKTFYQTTKHSSKKITTLDIFKTVGYILTAFVLSIGAIFIIGTLGQIIEFITNLLK